MKINRLVTELAGVSTLLFGLPYAAAAQNPQAAAFVRSQFPVADADGDGILTAGEFTAWIERLKAAELEQSGRAADPQAITAYGETALRLADKDGNGVLGIDELTGFFSR